MLSNKTYRLAELFLMFVLAPVSFTLPYSIWIKVGIGFFGLAYVIYILLKVEHLKFRIKPELDWPRFFKQVGLHFVIIVLFTVLYVLKTDPDQLFRVMLDKSMMWIIILFVYSLFSVYPQELIYRTFFFKRYEDLFNDKWLFVMLNAGLFSLAHIFFMNMLVMILTFLGGWLFALTFYRTRSTLMVSIEHAIYGCWLFTVGMGHMLGFPS
ncbi:MAG: CPBP family intramembrane metalloprotease [Bacteroidia bacterium]|nr:CPBP family intramembrane metalloprotease [Bacteroidia bacterium]